MGRLSEIAFGKQKKPEADFTDKVGDSSSARK